MSDVRATDALANERTFLAYARTALAFVGFGFVIARFALFVREAETFAHAKPTSTGVSTAFGATMAAAGVVCALYGGYRYVASARALRRGGVAPLSRWVVRRSSIVPKFQSKYCRGMLICNSA